MWKLLGRVLCGLGFHDFRVIDVTFGFGEGGSVEHFECPPLRPANHAPRVSPRGVHLLKLIYERFATTFLIKKNVVPTIRESGLE